MKRPVSLIFAIILFIACSGCFWHRGYGDRGGQGEHDRGGYENQDRRDHDNQYRGGHENQGSGGYDVTRSSRGLVIAKNGMDKAITNPGGIQSVGLLSQNPP